MKNQKPETRVILRIIQDVLFFIMCILTVLYMGMVSHLSAAVTPSDSQTIGAVTGGGAESLQGIKIALIIVIVLSLGLVIGRYAYAILKCQAQKKLEKKTYTDPHTGLPNKNRCDELLEDDKQVECTVCMMFEINGLKQVNETMGRSVGDSYILDFAVLLRKAVPEKDFVGRICGGMFMVVLEDASEESIRGLLEELDRTVKEFNSLHTTYRIRFSVGYAVSAVARPASLKELYEKAAAELHQDKGQGNAQADSLKGIHVLLAEGYDNEREKVKAMLEERGCVVFTAQDGEEAKEMFTGRCQGSFDLLLVNAKLPKIDGIELTRYIRNLAGLEARKIPIIGMTDGYSNECIEAGMNGCVDMPVEAEKLVTLGTFLLQ